MVPVIMDRRESTLAADPAAAGAVPAGTDLALVLSGGGARAAYQVGLLRFLARRMPDLSVQVLTGVSAGAINVAMLAADPGGLSAAVDKLTKLWSGLRAEDVFSADTSSLLRQVTAWGARLVSGGTRLGPRAEGMVDTAPLRRLLTRALDAGPDGRIPGIEEKLRANHLKAVAMTTLNYATGQTVTWVQGRAIERWEGVNRKSAKARLTVEHVMASSALPLAFPAVRLGRDWHGDGGVRLAAPLSPALHLGARRILAVSTRFQRTREEEDRPRTRGYPPPVQVLGLLMNAVFLDVLDEDVSRLERINRLLAELPPERRLGMRPVGILALRPSVDLGALAGAYEPKLPGFFKFLTRSLGTKETSSPDFLSLLMFQPDYLTRLIEIGEADAEARAAEIEALIHRPVPAGSINCEDLIGSLAGKIRGKGDLMSTREEESSQGRP
jgi:NTE family protein